MTILIKNKSGRVVNELTKMAFIFGIYSAFLTHVKDMDKVTDEEIRLTVELWNRQQYLSRSEMRAEVKA